MISSLSKYQQPKAEARGSTQPSRDFISDIFVPPTWLVLGKVITWASNDKQNLEAGHLFWNRLFHQRTHDTGGT